MASPSSVPSDTLSPAHRVLIDAHLLRHITSFKRGWPQALLDFWETNRHRDAFAKDCDKEYIPGQLMVLLMRYGDVRLAELTRGVRVWDDCGFWRGIDVHATYIEAVKHGRIDMLEWALQQHTNKHQLSVLYMWQTVFSDPAEEPAIFDYILSKYRDESLTEIRSRVSAAFVFARHRNGLVLVKWLTETLPQIKLPPDTTEEAAQVGNLALVQYLHVHRPHDGCTSRSFFIAKEKQHWDVLEYLLRHRREFYEPDLIKTAIGWGQIEVLQAITRMGLTELLQGHEEKLIDQVWYNREYTLRWCVDNHALARQSVSIDRLVWWNVFDLIQKLHDTDIARATTDAIDNACDVCAWDVVRFLLETRTEGFTHRALMAAEAFYRPDVVRLLHAHAHLNKSPAHDQEEENDENDEPRRKRQKLIDLFRTQQECADDAVVEKAASSGRVDVLEAAQANGSSVNDVVSIVVIEAALKSQETTTIQYLFSNYPASFGPEILASVLLNEAFDLWMTLSELYPDQAEAVLPTALSQAAEEYRLRVIRFVVGVLGRRDLVQHAMDAADKVDNAEYSAAVNVITNTGSNTSAVVVAGTLNVMLTDPRTPSWAVRMVVAGAGADDVPDKYQRTEHWTWAVLAIYKHDQLFLELVHEMARATQGGVRDQPVDSLLSFAGARAAAVRIDDLAMLQWLMKLVCDEYPVETSLLDEAIFYHQRQIAEWLATHYPEACQAFAVEEKPLLVFCPCGFDMDMLEWIETTPAVREVVDFGALACYAVQLGDVASVQRMYETYPEEFMAQTDLTKWLKPEHLDVHRYLREINHPSATATDTSVALDSSR